MTEQPGEYEDQDSEPTQKAPEEGRPDGTVADDDQDHEPGEHIGPPE
ncbi:hypothetical protein [Kribbella sp. CA-293567]|nr:hypothetical protein [Kribbella sp. CA-293567]WBQ08317.1 hypothetical protein OX958_16250 [Kribbella sp. CA-293567]